MYGLSIEQNNFYNSNIQNLNSQIEGKSDLDRNSVVDKVSESRINTAVNLSISNDNVQNFLNSKSAEYAKGNTNAQQVLSQISGGQSDYASFFEGEKFEKDFSLESIGYEGKPLSDLSKEEAKDLLKKDSFFGEDETAKRIEAYVEKITGNDVDALEEVKKGLKRGYEEAQKLFGEKLPPESNNTEKKVFDVIERKIDEMLKTDLERKVDAKFLENNKL